MGLIDITISKKGYKSKRMLQHHTGAATFSIRKRHEIYFTVFSAINVFAWVIIEIKESILSVSKSADLEV